MNEQTGLDVGRVLTIVRGRWKIVLSITVLAAAAAYCYVTYIAKPVFEASAFVTYQAPARDSNPTGGVLPSTGITREDIGTLVANATNPAVVDAAAATLSMESADLRRAVKVQPYGEASIVSVVAKAGTPEAAAQRANAWAKAFVTERTVKAKKNLDAEVFTKQKAYNALPDKYAPENPLVSQKIAAGTELSAVKSDRTQWLSALSVSNEAQLPEAAIWPKKSFTMIAALLIGIGLGSGVALLTARVDNRLHDDEFDALPAPVLVRVPVSPRAPKGTPLAPAMAEPMIADAFAGLGARVMLDRVGDGAHSILVTSARSGEGKSSVAANLASALALGGRRVVLIDADMRRPTQDQIFPMLQGRPGLSQVLTRGAELESALTLVSPNLAAIPSGPRHTNASMLLASVAFRQLLDRLAQISEVIIIDAPPVLAVNDALAVSPATDQVLLVARVGTSDLGEINEAHSRLSRAATTPQAMVLNGTERPHGYGYDQELKSTGSTSMPAPAPQAAVANRIASAQAHDAASARAELVEAAGHSNVAASQPPPAPAGPPPPTIAHQQHAQSQHPGQGGPTPLPTQLQQAHNPAHHHGAPPASDTGHGATGAVA